MGSEKTTLEGTAGMRTLWHDLTDGAPWYRKVAFAWLAIAAVLAVLGILAFFSRFLSVFGWWGLLGSFS